MESDLRFVPDGAVADAGDPAAAGDEAYSAWPGSEDCRLGSVKLPGN